MSYVTVRARDKLDQLLYERDFDASVFSLVGSYITQGLRLHGLISQGELYCLLVKPRFSGTVEHPTPRLFTVEARSSSLLVPAPQNL